MATTTHGTPGPVGLASRLNHDTEDLWDQNIKTLLNAGDIEGARAEVERQCLVSLDSGDLFDTLPIGWDSPRVGSPGYAVDILLERGDVAGAKAELERLVLEGIDSGDPLRMTPRSWEQIRLDLHKRHCIS